ncbi:MAG: glycosyltransferase, partial [Phycisphaeraceae bacterium]|nr:glycosyltransferase [Phycisphaeraceae bacterium]
PAARDADLLLFADADTTFHPGCVRATAALLHQRGLALLSLMSTLTADRWFEKFVQPAAGLELMCQYPLLRASRPTDRRAFANGQFMLFRADAYRRIGGHETVREHLLEDLALARETARHGLPAALLLADGMLICRMYETWAEFRRGWKRIYTECANRRPARLRRAALRVAIVNGLLPLAAAACFVVALSQRGVAPAWATAVPMAVAGVGLSVWFAAMLAVYRLSAAPLWSAALHPFASFPVASILAEAARDLRSRTPTQWGGRSYVRESR